MSTDVDTLYGLTAVPADQTKSPPTTTNPPSPIDASTIKIPQTPLARRINKYASHALPRETYLHSLRVYTYSRAIAQGSYPEQQGQYKIEPNSKLDETWFVTAMLHDLGTTPEAITATKLSYEFWAGVEALRLLQDPWSTGDATAGAASAEGSCGGEGEGEGQVEEDGTGKASREQAESVAEAIIRHQDVQPKGNISLMTRLIHWGTLLDNVGAGRELVHPDTIRSVNEMYSRKGWSGCFRGTVETEKRLKPWAMVSRIEGFEDAIEEYGEKNSD